MVEGVLYLSYSVVSALKCVVTKRKKIAGVLAELTPHQKTLSGLIEAVYLVDDGEHEKAGKILEEIGYRVEDFDETIHVTPAHSGMEEIRIQVFGRLEPQQAHERGIKPPLPNHVVAIRGTNFRSISDISDDYRVLSQDLHNSPGYGHIKQTITSAIDKYNGDNNICVAGHSLGAAFALLVTRELALNDQPIETHLFNPPFVTPDLTFRKRYKLLLQPFKYIVQSRNLQQLGSALVTAMFERVRLLEAPAFSVTKIRAEFSVLQESQWQPYLYLNSQDIICNKYIDYFEDPYKSLARYMGPNSVHMIPKATVIINQKTSCLDMLASHANKQWFEDLTQKLTKKSYNVINPCFPYQCNGLEGDGRAPNSDLCTPPSPEIDLDEDLTCWASLEEVSSSPDVANHGGDSSPKSSLYLALQLQVPRNGDTNASSGRWRKVNEARTGCLDNVTGAVETLSAITTPQQRGGSDHNTLNILLLGETGVGKSTFINALCNYLSFDSFESARDGELQPLIYSEFQFRGKSITCGKRDDDEGASNRKPGSSCTQRCRAYTFTQEGENQKIRLIDTPGIADTNGITSDEQNMKDILSCLSEYEVLHAICILLKPNEVRLTPVLKYCIVQLLAHLHKDATSNIVFCFTNSSPSMFEAGGTLNLLQHVLSESPQTAAIKLDEETMYYFDSEGFRYLACEKRGLEFKTTQTNVFKSSWEHSSDEASRLIKHIASLEPHDVKSTLSLNLVRDIFAGIEGPLAMIAEALQHNLEQTKRNTKEIVRLLETHGSNAEIRKALIIEEEVVETVKLDNTRTICKSMICKGRICHDPCEIHETLLGIGQAVFWKGERQLFCQKFSLGSSACTVCGCSRSSHIRVGVETRRAVRRRENEDIRKAIDEAGDGIQKASTALRLLEATERSYQEEMKVVVNAAALFAGFLAQNSIVVYHIATVEYLKSQIAMKKKSADGDEGKQQLEELEAHLRTYEQKVQSFRTRSGPSSSETITLGDVEDEVEKLYGLSKSGAAIRETMQDIKKGYRMNQDAGIRREEVICTIPTPCPPGAATSSGRLGLGRVRGLFRSSNHTGVKGGDERTKKP
jgi:GTPase SAR1 family protein